MLKKKKNHHKMTSDLTFKCGAGAPLMDQNWPFILFATLFPEKNQARGHVMIDRTETR